ncbi:MAG: hypothetical protein IJC34_03440 [Lentisphaeria bacterium]|nr:hypothetical protein [Lentisphaeria bacterium]MBQ7394252.1 hypothetical protein [Lentisphaeria bacterium]
MKKLMLMCALVGVAALFAGCSSLQAVGTSKLSGQSLTQSGNTVAHISATTAGYYFLWIPLFVGSEKAPGSIAVLNEDTANVTAATRMVTRKAQELGATRVIDLVSTKTSSGTGPIPLLFYWKTATVSGNAVR